MSSKIDPMSDEAGVTVKHAGDQGGGQDMQINILTYHSISHAPGPTSIPPETFAGHIDALAACGYQAVPLSTFAAWRAGETALAPRTVVITFDDGFADFAEQAFPKLRERNWAATVFLPSGKLGGVEDWAGAEISPPRPLLRWEQVVEMARQGIEFGSHSVNHPDLTTLSLHELRRELQESRDAIAERLDQPPISFAPPYGRTNRVVRGEIGEVYGVSVGTRLQRATARSDRYDLPRIEMHYFRDLRRWRAFLEGRGEGYFACRRALRGVREFVSQGWGR